MSITIEELSLGIDNERYLELLEMAESKKDRRLVGILNRLIWLPILQARREKEKINYREATKKFEIISEIHSIRPNDSTLAMLEEIKKKRDSVFSTYSDTHEECVKHEYAIQKYKTELKIRERKIELLTELIEIKKRR